MQRTAWSILMTFLALCERASSEANGVVSPTPPPHAPIGRRVGQVVGSFLWNPMPHQRNSRIPVIEQMNAGSQRGRERPRSWADCAAQDPERCTPRRRGSLPPTLFSENRANARNERSVMKSYIPKQPKHQRERVEVKLDERLVRQAGKILRIPRQRSRLRSQSGA